MPELKGAELDIHPDVNKIFDDCEPVKAVVNNVKDGEVAAKVPLRVMYPTFIGLLIILVVMPVVWNVFIVISWGYLHRLGVDDVLVSHVLLEGLKIWANVAIEFWKILMSGLLAHLFDVGIMLW